MLAAKTLDPSHDDVAPPVLTELAPPTTASSLNCGLEQFIPYAGVILATSRLRTQLFLVDILAAE